MLLSSGARLGPYEIVSRLGAGGMGEVYRAHDARIGRDVAIKILPFSFAQDEERLRRFQQEARAAGSLNHPNILSIYDVGTDNNSPYLVSELLEGETLRAVLQRGAIGVRKAIEFGLQIAHGLAAAHEKGIIHRDLKPENIFVTKDGRLKILDFGLAKLTQADTRESQLTRASTIAPQTESGIVLGTVVYMSPEQVRGQAVGHRCDIFAFGTILYEMLSGNRPFQGESSIEVMNAILKEDPPELPVMVAGVSPSLERIVRRCLQKETELRFQSASDLAFALETVSGEAFTIRTRATSTKARTSKLPFLIVVAVLLAGICFFAGKWVATKQTPVKGQKVQLAPFSLHRLTFRNGAVPNAQFSPDGQTIIYDAQWGGNHSQIFFTRPGSPESRSLGFPGETSLCAVSSTGDIAVKLAFSGEPGPLALSSFTGGGLRQIAEGIFDADFSPDGKQLAVVRGRQVLEFPIRKVLYKTDHVLFSPRVSPRGTQVTFIEMHYPGIGIICVVDLSGKVERLYEADMSRSGLNPRLAWAPSGEEIWFTQQPKAASGWALYAVTLNKQVREILPMNGILRINDISADGRVLLSQGIQRASLIYSSPGRPATDLSWFDRSIVADISEDGKTILFSEMGEGAPPGDAVYLRNLDAPEAIRLGDGFAWSLSPDGKWALTSYKDSLMAIPTGPGQARTIRAAVEPEGAYWFSDGKRILFAQTEPGHRSKLYVYDFDNGTTRAVTEEGIAFPGWGVQNAISPDGNFVLVVSDEKGIFIYSLRDRKHIQIPGLGKDSPIRWSKDGRSIYVDSSPGIFRLDIATGKRELWKDLTPSDPSGVHGTFPMLTADGKTVVCSYLKTLTDLYLAEGLK